MKPRDRSVNFSMSILPPACPVRAQALQDTASEERRQAYMGIRNPACKAGLCAKPNEKSRLGLRVFALVLVRAAFGKREGGSAALLGRRLKLGLTFLTRLTVGVLGGLLGLILGQLSLLGRHDAVIMLRMLKIILGHHPVAAGIGVTGQLKIFLIDVAGGAANLDLGTRRIERPVRVEPAAAIVMATAATTAIAVLRPAAASA